ncbi:MAG: ATP-binding protein [Salinigranum sp.]
MPDEDTFRQIAENLTEVVWLVDPHFETLLYINPAYESLVGRPVDVAGDGIDFPLSVHPDDWEAFRGWIDAVESDVATAERGDAPHEYEVEIRIERPDGEVRWVDTVAVPICDADGTVGAIAGISTDVTDRVRRERELEETVERLDQFASMLSHDLQNPLSIALGRLELYRETGEEANLDAVEEALQRIEDLTVDLTSLARTGSSANEHEPTSLGSVARTAWETIDTRSATLSTEDRTVVGDRAQLRALFENLFRNAVGHGGPDVTVRVGPLDGGFYVEDTGSGVPEDLRERVFQHGFTTGYGGSGVGLTIVGRIADAHGFEVSLGEGRDGGARFEFSTRE